MTVIPHNEHFVGMKFHLTDEYVKSNQRLQFIAPQNAGRTSTYYLNTNAILRLYAFVGADMLCSMKISDEVFGYAFVDDSGIVAYWEDQDDRLISAHQAPGRFELDE